MAVLLLALVRLLDLAAVPAFLAEDFRLVVLLAAPAVLRLREAEDFLAAGFRAADFLAAGFRAEDFRVVEAFLTEDFFLAVDFRFFVAGFLRAII